jgi:HPr kinase/phosphorylase
VQKGGFFKLYTVLIEKLVEEFKLENVIPDISLAGRTISSPFSNRPALQLAGFFDYFENERIQIIGMVEYAYLKKLDDDFRESVLRELFSYGFPCMIICRNLDVFPEIIPFAREFNVPVFRTPYDESDFVPDLNVWLRSELAQRITIHGVLIDIYGVGVLIIGDSGIGKSETALELIKRGHRLVADDAVEIKKVSHDQLIGTCPDIIRHFIEIRGIGVLNVKELFGVGAVKKEQQIDLVIKLEMWDESKTYNRFGMEDEYYELLGNKIFCNSIPIRAGRNMAMICEAAAINRRQRLFGYNAAEALNERIIKNNNQNKI